MNSQNNSFSSLICISWNCNSITGKINELRDFITRHPHTDIIFLQETKIPILNFNISGYRRYHNPRNSSPHFGGTAIYIKSHIPHHLIPHTNIANIDHTGIALNLPNNQINLFSIYVPPRGRFPTNSLDSFFTTNQPTFIAGDFNAKSTHWNCTRNTTRGNSLHNFISHHQISLHAPSTPTHISTNTNHRDSIIDLAISKNLPYPITTTTINDLSSDHLPVSFKIDLINPITAPPPLTPLTGINTITILQTLTLISQP